MLFTLEVSHSSLENADQPLAVDVILELSTLKVVRDLFPINPFAKAAAPSSPIFMPRRSRSDKLQCSARNSDDKDANPFAVIELLCERDNSDRLQMFAMPSTKD